MNTSAMYLAMKHVLASERLNPPSGSPARRSLPQVQTIASGFHFFTDSMIVMNNLRYCKSVTPSRRGAFTAVGVKKKKTEIKCMVTEEKELEDTVVFADALSDIEQRSGPWKEALHVFMYINAKDLVGEQKCINNTISAKKRQTSLETWICTDGCLYPDKGCECALIRAWIYTEPRHYERSAPVKSTSILDIAISRGSVPEAS